MKKHQNTLSYSPLNAQEVSKIKDKLEAAILTEMGEMPFACSLALYWSSEDKKALNRIARFDINAYDGKIVEAEQLPPEHAAKRVAIDRSFELVSAALIAQRKGWLNVSTEQFLSALPEYLSFDNDDFLLWKNQGALYATFLSTADSTVTEGLFYDDFMCHLGDDMPRLRDCREYTADREEVCGEERVWLLGPQK
ncbi:MAG: hypothetical protein LBN05_05735 [Oscillospiraceae bacterium]|jgi:hypothetical protein|nr:hypothetical protein [Oscillospiraceae bacterium]